MLITNRGPSVCRIAHFQRGFVGDSLQETHSKRRRRSSFARFRPSGSLSGVFESVADSAAHPGQQPTAYQAQQPAVNILWQRFDILQSLP